MNWDKYLEAVKKDIQRSFEATRELKLDRTYLIRLYIIFILNILGIVGFALLKEEFPLHIFVALWLISALVIGNILWHIFSKEIQKTMPNLFDVECQKRGVPAHEFKCRIIFIGHMHLRGFSCKIRIYHNEILIKYRKYCLIINSAEYVKMEKFLMIYRAEFERDGKYVQCHMNSKQAEIMQQWITDNSRKGKI